MLLYHRLNLKTVCQIKEKTKYNLTLQKTMCTVIVLTLEKLEAERIFCLENAKTFQVFNVFMTLHIKSN